MSATCKTCRWWDGDMGHPAYDFGLCCKNAPHTPFVRRVTIERREIQMEMSFPPTKAANWCGEHQPREVQP